MLYFCGMRKIGNIITEIKSSKFPSCFNVYGDLSYIDKSVPTIVVGFDKSVSVFGKVDTINRIDETTGFYWTFAKMESRQDFEKDMEKFMKVCVDNVSCCVEYQYFDVMKYRYSKIKRIISFMNSMERKMCYITKNNNFVFIYSSKYGKVFGLSLSLLEYMGIPKEKVVARLKSNKMNWVVYNYMDVYGTFGMAIGDNTHLVPVLSECVKRENETI